MKPYFAYASNMDLEQMARRCAGAVLAGVAMLPGRRFIVTREGYGSVVPDSAGTVHGVAWQLTEADERALDAYEGVPEGLYRKEMELVHPRAQAKPLEALVYVARERARGTPQPGYMEAVVRAARWHGFPAAYLAELARWLPGGSETAGGSGP